MSRAGGNYTATLSCFQHARLRKRQQWVFCSCMTRSCALWSKPHQLRVLVAAGQPQVFSHCCVSLGHAAGSSSVRCTLFQGTPGRPSQSVTAVRGSQQHVSDVKDPCQLHIEGRWSDAIQAAPLRMPELHPREQDLYCTCHSPTESSGICGFQRAS